MMVVFRMLAAMVGSAAKEQSLCFQSPTPNTRKADLGISPPLVSICFPQIIVFGRKKKKSRPQNIFELRLWRSNTVFGWHARGPEVNL